jgi:hypothetical protein
MSKIVKRWVLAKWVLVAVVVLLPVGVAASPTRATEPASPKATVGELIRESPSPGLDENFGEIVIDCDAPGAVVSYDDGAVTSPRLRGPGGRLVPAVVQAPGRVPWASVFRIETGVRLRQRVILAPAQSALDDVPSLLDEQLWRDYRRLYEGPSNVPAWAAVAFGVTGVGLAVLGGFTLNEGITRLQDPRDQYRFKCELMPCEQRFNMRRDHWVGVVGGGFFALLGGTIAVLGWKAWIGSRELEQLDLRIQADAAAMGIAVGGRL